MKRSDRRKRSLERKPGNRSGRRVLIVCEGKSERRYFEGLKRLLRNPGVLVELVDDAGSAPISVVDRALEERHRARREREPYDSVWCVFDLDQHESFYRSVDKARANSLNLAISVICFEFWILLHYTNTSRPFPNCDSVLKELQARNNSYEKTSVSDELLTLRRFAMERAERLARDNKKAKPSEPWPNPSTTVHELVRYLEELVPYELPA